MYDAFDQAKELRRIWSNFQSSRVLLTANNYRVFDYLNTQRTLHGVAKKLDTDIRATRILLDALTGMGLLKKQNGKYINSKMASQFLVSKSALYQGNIIQHADILWDNWSGLDRVMKTGIPHRRSQNHRAFILGMHNISVLKVKKVVKAIGLSGVKKALDLGGGPGTYAAEMAQRGIETVLFDTPDTIKIARGLFGQRKWKPPGFIQGDFLVDDIGSGYDIILISQVFHSYSEKDNIRIIKKCRRALKTGGRVVVQEFFINDEMTRPLWSVLFSVNMLVNTSGGRCYTPEEMKTWFLKTGFKRVSKKFVADTILISAKK
jgi:ubiquinone/menaquinone biosynthesis C-methylase UbiE